MNALAGSWLLKFCAEKLLPVYNMAKDTFMPLDDNVTEEELARINSERTGQILTLLPQALASLSESDLMSFEMKCLQTVEAWYPAGYQPVMNGRTFGDPYIEYDVGAMLRLVYEVLLFNLGSFFGEGSLVSLLSRLNSHQQNA